MMKLSVNRVNTLVKQRNWPYGSYITACGDKIYQANNNTSTVICYTIKGEQLWEYKDVSVLNDPWGVTVGNNYKVYVTSRTSNSVIVIEPDGRQGRQLINSDEGFEYPIGIYVNKFKNTLLAINYQGPAFLYDMC